DAAHPQPDRREGDDQDTPERRGSMHDLAEPVEYLGKRFGNALLLGCRHQADTANKPDNCTDVVSSGSQQPVNGLDGKRHRGDAPASGSHHCHSYEVAASARSAPVHTAVNCSRVPMKVLMSISWVMPPGRACGGGPTPSPVNCHSV